MNHPMRMKMPQTLRRLPRDRSDLTFRHDVASHDVRQTPTFHVLHHDPEIPFVQEGIDEVDDVGVSGGLHDQDLVDD
jgi:hypothetical protein